MRLIGYVLMTVQEPGTHRHSGDVVSEPTDLLEALNEKHRRRRENREVLKVVRLMGNPKSPVVRDPDNRDYSLINQKGSEAAAEDLAAVGIDEPPSADQG